MLPSSAQASGGFKGGYKKRIIDYIFYTGDTLECTSRLWFPFEEDLKDSGEEREGLFLIPSKLFPSDHFSVAANFKFK